MSDSGCPSMRSGAVKVCLLLNTGVCVGTIILRMGLYQFTRCLGEIFHSLMLKPKAVYSKAITTMQGGQHGCGKTLVSIKIPLSLLCLPNSVFISGLDGKAEL